MVKEYILHIETAPLPMEQLIAKAPVFKAAANLKDVQKIAEDIEKKKKKYFEEASFSEVTGYICAIAWMNISDEEVTILNIHEHTEEDMLRQLYAVLTAEPATLVFTFRGERFMFPYISRRALKYGINFFKLFLGAIAVKNMDFARLWACGNVGHPDNIQEMTSVLDIVYTPPEKPYYELLEQDAGVAEKAVTDYMRTALLPIRKLLTV